MLIRRKTPDVIRRKSQGCSQREKSFDEFDAFNMCRLYIEPTAKPEHPPPWWKTPIAKPGHLFPTPLSSPTVVTSAGPSESSSFFFLSATLSLFPFFPPFTTFPLFPLIPIPQHIQFLFFSSSRASPLSNAISVPNAACIFEMARAS